VRKANGRESLIFEPPVAEYEGEVETRKTAIALSGGLPSKSDGQHAGLAPFVSASGQGLVADQIIALAEANGVPVEHDPALASLLAGLRIGQYIPPELYQAIAELLVFLYDVDSRVA
jgi:flagellar biosynthesis protein